MLPGQKRQSSGKVRWPRRANCLALTRTGTACPQHPPTLGRKLPRQSGQYGTRERSSCLAKEAAMRPRPPEFDQGRSSEETITSEKRVSKGRFQFVLVPVQQSRLCVLRCPALPALKHTLRAFVNSLNIRHLQLSGNWNFRDVELQRSLRHRPGPWLTRAVSFWPLEKTDDAFCPT